MVRFLEPETNEQCDQGNACGCDNNTAKSRYISYVIGLIGGKESQQYGKHTGRGCCAETERYIAGDGNESACVTGMHPAGRRHDLAVIGRIEHTHAASHDRKTESDRPDGRMYGQCGQARIG